MQHWVTASILDNSLAGPNQYIGLWNRMHIVEHSYLLDANVRAKWLGSLYYCHKVLFMLYCRDNNDKIRYFILYDVSVANKILT